jgi:flagellar biosynthetic protein FliR
LNYSEAELLLYSASFIWPLLRIGAMFAAMPLVSMETVPPRVRLVLTVALTVVIRPLLPPTPPLDLFGHDGLLITIQQVVIGLVTGFILQMVFAAVVFAGQGIAFSIGLGFATMIDPQNSQPVPVVAQFYVISTMLIFLSLNGHLLIIQMLFDSFHTLPISIEGINKADLWTVIAWSSRMFAGGLLLSLPVMVSLLLINIGFGVATRAAPQLNIFSVGFPITLMLGIIVMWQTVPDMLEQVNGILTESYGLLSKLLRV